MRITTLLATTFALTAALAAGSRYQLTLERAKPDGAALTLMLDCADGAFALAGGDASAVRLDGTKLRGKVEIREKGTGNGEQEREQLKLSVGGATLQTCP